MRLPSIMMTPPDRKTAPELTPATGMPAPLGSASQEEPTRLIASPQSPRDPGPQATGPCLIGGRPLERLAHYRLIRPLGQGGMGAVFEAWDEKLERTCALKVIAQDQMDYTALQRLRQEARSAARLNHPNIVTVHALEEVDDLTFIVMEKIDGRDLNSLVHREGPLVPARALSYIRSAAAALSFAAKNRIIHRDIKPANLLLTNDDQLKVADFGLAKQLDHDLALTATNTVVGSPLFMAPEQGMDADIDHRADIYSLGITLFLLLTGRPPFESNTALSVMLKHAKEPLPEPDRLRSIAGGRLLSLLKRMTAKAPADRFATHDDLIAEIDAVLRLLQGVQVPATNAETALAVGLRMGTFPTTYGQAMPSGQTPRPGTWHGHAPSAGGSGMWWKVGLGIVLFAGLGFGAYAAFGNTKRRPAVKPSNASIPAVAAPVASPTPAPTPMPTPVPTFAPPEMAANAQQNPQFLPPGPPSGESPAEMVRGAMRYRLAGLIRDHIEIYQTVANSCSTGDLATAAQACQSVLDDTMRPPLDRRLNADLLRTLRQAEAFQRRLAPGLTLDQQVATAVEQLRVLQGPPPLDAQAAFFLIANGQPETAGKAREAWRSKHNDPLLDEELNTATALFQFLHETVRNPGPAGRNDPAGRPPRPPFGGPPRRP